MGLMTMLWFGSRVKVGVNDGLEGVSADPELNLLAGSGGHGVADLVCFEHINIRTEYESIVH